MCMTKCSHELTIIVTYSWTWKTQFRYGGSLKLEAGAIMNALTSELDEMPVMVSSIIANDNSSIKVYNYV